MKMDANQLTDQHPSSSWYFYHIPFSFLYLFWSDRFNLCSRWSVPPLLRFLLDFGSPMIFSWYKFYFSHNFLVIMIFLYIFTRFPITISGRWIKLLWIFFQIKVINYFFLIDCSFSFICWHYNNTHIWMCQ